MPIKNYDGYYEDMRRNIIFGTIFPIRSYMIAGTDHKPSKAQIDAMHWFAVYTRSRCEKRVAASLCDDGIEAWVPLQKTLRQWSDRKKWVEVPLFNSYIFIHTTLSVIKQLVHQTDGAVYVVQFQDRPAIVPDSQIEGLRMLLNASEKFEICPIELSTGSSVEVVRGPLRGLKGIFTEYKGRKRVMMRIDAINQYLYIEIDPSYLKITGVRELLTA
jgi:transcription antitermination factor NusG